MLLKDGDAAIPLVDTTHAHAMAAVDRALMFKGAS
jgi:aspartate/glutamate racemase